MGAEMDERWAGTRVPTSGNVNSCLSVQKKTKQNEAFRTGAARGGAYVPCRWRRG
jgi:hypothetical protein